MVGPDKSTLLCLQKKHIPGLAGNSQLVRPAAHHSLKVHLLSHLLQRPLPSQVLLEAAYGKEDTVASF